MQNHPEEYAKERAKAQKLLDELTPLRCFCGASSYRKHTDWCKRFQDIMQIIIISRLKKLLPE